MGNVHSPPKPIQPPEDLHVFKGMDTVPMEYSIPEITGKRKPTDRFFLILYIFLLVVWAVVSAFTLWYSDLKRITNGYDNCGNVCGEENPYIDGINCTGKDYREEKFLLYEHSSAAFNLDNLDLEPNECVRKCDRKEYFTIMNRCFQIAHDNDSEKAMVELDLIIDQQILQDLKNSTGYIVGMVFIALGFCFITLILFKYLLGFIIRSVLILTMIVSIVYVAIICTSGRKFGIGAKIFAALLCLVLNIGVILSWKKVNFVIRIFKETTQVIFTMPFLMLVPIWVFLIEILLTLIFIFLLVMFYTSGILTHIFGPYYTYMPTGMMVLALFSTILIFCYTCEFLNGCQRMIVAGSVSTWYFTRDKENILGSPITESFRILIKYHLGSVAFGSFIISFMNIVRIIVKGMSKKKEFFLFRFVISCCVDFLEEVIHYISSQAYIMIAMHGEPFIPSGKRATKLLIENALNTLAVNSIGDFVLLLVKILITLLTIISGFILDDGNIAFFGVVIFIGGVLAFMLAHCVFRTFEICVDTIFLCYCEDTFIHDGIERPYYAPPEMQALVDEAKGIVEEEKMYNSIKTQELPQSFV
ncbi:choline transporter-like protein 1 [Coccinella septempunctata]|uniref:choline transporter-like protein 1 n=1 Tax=Coccinella septempunctata TaxID=41139 RepID=UPI001D08BE11|nr:choline transporter-like protein 1 [Coccinella septempunctata]